MLAASTLIGGLGGEKERWTEQSKEFEAQIGRLVSKMFLLNFAILSRWLHGVKAYILFYIDRRSI